jgi:hypothetical protein
LLGGVPLLGGAAYLTALGMLVSRIPRRPMPWLALLLSPVIGAPILFTLADDVGFGDPIIILFAWIFPLACGVLFAASHRLLYPKGLR